MNDIENFVKQDSDNKIKNFFKGDGTYTVHGPYKRKDGRQHAIIINKDKNNKETSRRTVSYPKLIAEILLDGDVWSNETIDHFDRNFDNNDHSNLYIRKLSDHASLDALRVKVENAKCSYCNNIFTPSVTQRNTTKEKAGPFCSRQCSGKYGSGVQNGSKVLVRKEVVKTYYHVDK